MHEDELQQIGLTEKEAKVYLTTLELGKATANDITRKSGLKRPTTYFTIDVLMKKGLMSSVHEGKKQFFMAENPDRLVDVFERKQDEMRRQGERLKKMIPDLKKLSPKIDGGPVVKYYQGKEGILTILKEALTWKDEEVCMIYPYDLSKKLLSADEAKELKLSNSNNKIHINSLYTSSEGDRESSPNSTRIRINEAEYPLDADVCLFKDRVRIITTDAHDEPIGIYIYDHKIAGTLLSLFKLAWSKANPHK